MVDPIAIKSPSLFWANLHEYNHSVVVGSFIAKKFFLPTLSDAHLTAHFLRVAGAQICIWFGLQKHLSVSRFRFLFCKSSCCQPPKSICQSHVANFVSLIFSLLPIPPLPSTALKFPETGTLFKIVRYCIDVMSNVNWINDRKQIFNRYTNTFWDMVIFCTDIHPFQASFGAIFWMIWLLKVMKFFCSAILCISVLISLISLSIAHTFDPIFPLW